MLKRISFIVLMTVLLISGVTMAAGPLKVLIWTGYYNQEVFTDFEKANGVKVAITHFDTYDQCLKLVKSGQYDLVITGELLYPTLVKEGLLEPLDKTKVPNFKNLDPLFKNLPFDPNNKYTMPYHYIYIGLIYRKGKVNPTEVTLQNYFEAPAKFKGRVTSFPDKRIMIGMAMKYMGRPLNSTDPKDLKLAKELLMNLKGNLTAGGKNVNRGILDGYQEVINGQADMAISYAAQSTRKVLNAVDKIGIVLPKEGAIIGTDDMAVIKGAANKDLAFKLINHFYDPKIAAKSMNYLGNPFPVVGIKQYLNKELANNAEVYPPADVVKKLEFFEPMTPDQLKVYDQVWAEVFGK